MSQDNWNSSKPMLWSNGCTQCRVTTCCHSAVAQQHPITLKTWWDQVRWGTFLLCFNREAVGVFQYPGQWQAFFKFNRFRFFKKLWMWAPETFGITRSSMCSWKARGMFRKINHVFRPNHHAQRNRSARGGCGLRSEDDYHNACTVRLVRSTSMLVVGERTQTAAGSTLKRSKSTVSIESTLYYYQRQEDQIWLYSQNQNCLEYLEALVALRRQYIKSLCGLKTQGTNDQATVSSKKKSAPLPPKKEEQVSVCMLYQSSKVTCYSVTSL